MAAARRIFKGMNRASNFTELVTKESPRLFELIKDTVHAFKAKKDEAFKQFLPATNEFITKASNFELKWLIRNNFGD